jgi:hypothetical protein
VADPVSIIVWKPVPKEHYLVPAPCLLMWPDGNVTVRHSHPNAHDPKARWWGDVPLWWSELPALPADPSERLTLADLRHLTLAGQPGAYIDRAAAACLRANLPGEEGAA